MLMAGLVLSARLLVAHSMARAGVRCCCGGAQFLGQAISGPDQPHSCLQQIRQGFRLDSLASLEGGTGGAASAGQVTSPPAFHALRELSGLRGSLTAGRHA